MKTRKIAVQQGRAPDRAIAEELFIQPEKPADAPEKPSERNRGGRTCACCNSPLNEDTGVYAPSERFPRGFYPICLACQQKRYAEIAAKTSRTYALFYACMAFDVPYKAEIIEGMQANQNGVWFEYVKRLQRGYVGANEPKVETWADGVTDIRRAFGGEMPVLPITGDVVVSNMGEMSDKERWKIEWGEEWSAQDCRRMDSRYMMLASEFKGGPMPPRVSMTLHDIVRLMLLRDQNIKTDAMAAKRYQEMIDKIMSSEDLKAGGKRQQENTRVDKLVMRLEQMGAIRDGFLVSYDELVDILRDQHGNYKTSLDVVDTMMMCIINTMRKNMGQPELTVLPVSAQVTDTKGELLSRMSDEERAIMNDLGLVPPEREAKPGAERA